MEELKQLLLTAYLELEEASTSAETQRRLQEDRLLHLQEALTSTRRERDKAREQLMKVEAEYSNRQNHVMSSDQSQQTDTKLASADLEVNLSTMNYNFFSQSAHQPSLVDHLPNNNNCPPLGDQPHWNSTPAHHFDFTHLNLPADVDLRRPPISSSSVHCPNLMELQGQPLYDQKQQGLCFIEGQEFQQQHHIQSQLPSVVDHKLQDYDFCQWKQEPPPTAGIRESSNPLLGIPEVSVSYHMTHRKSPKSIHAPPPSTLGCRAGAMLPNMPEPTAGTFPERGKLLQAVMQAGPLLEMLLLTGPLPQWKTPPPVPDTVEIPRISVSSSPNFQPIGPISPLPQWRSPPPVPERVEIPRISMRSSPGFLPIDPIAHPLHNIHGHTDLKSAVSSSHRSLRPRRRINKPSTATVISSQQSGTEAALISSQWPFTPVLNSMNNTITCNLPVNFAKMH